MADILYVYKTSIYANLTNKCPCRCTFCIRNNTDAIGNADTLWHKHDPSIEEIKKAVDDNVDEVDIVAPISAMKSGDWTYVMSEFESLTRLSHMRNIVCKWIIEINLLTEEEIAQVCKIGVAKEVDFIKTSTGTYGDAVTPEAIARLRALLPPQVKIKASGGIRTREQAEELIASGADRIGASSKKLLTNT